MRAQCSELTYPSVQVGGQSDHVVPPVSQGVAHPPHQLSNVTVEVPQGVKQSHHSAATESGILLLLLLLVVEEYFVRNRCVALRSDFLESVLELLK